MSKPADLGHVASSTVQAAERREAAEQGGNGVGNILLAIERNLPAALIEANERRAKLVMELAAVCAEITKIETHRAHQYRGKRGRKPPRGRALRWGSPLGGHRRRC